MDLDGHEFSPWVNEYTYFPTWVFREWHERLFTVWTTPGNYTLAKVNTRTQITFHWVTMLFILLVGSELQFFENIWVFPIRYQDEECHEVTSFLLKGFTDNLELQIILFFLFPVNLPLHSDWKFGPGCISHWGLPAPATPCTIFWVCFHLWMPAIPQ